MTASPQAYRLLVVETASIQKYIFNSNRLRENIGASYLVAAATGDWAFEAVRQVVEASGGAHNITGGNALDDTVTIEQAATSAEVLYAGGGNFVALFRDEATAEDFTWALSSKVLAEAPGLRLGIHDEPFIPGEDVFGDTLRNVFDGLKNKRSTQSSVMPMAGLGVTVMCDSTALPAVGFDRTSDKKRPIAAEVRAKIDAAKAANDDLEWRLPPGEGHTYPSDLDDLGRTRGESSMIAVVHADGDGIGQLIQGIAQKYRDASHVRQHIQALRDFSRFLNNSAQAALQATLHQLQQGFTESADLALLFTGKRDEQGRIYLPFRPLVFGGDDVTFVCDGRIGLTLALAYVRNFQAITAEAGKPLTACAGISIVKSHYPFARAYQLAEELGASAKKYRRELQREVCCLDWHMAASGIFGELEGIREREYQVSQGSLTLRPVTVDEQGGRHSWPVIAAGLQAFQGEDWQAKRNKAKMLREKLRGGPHAVEEFETLYGQDLPKINGFKHGWQENYCGYFDALELMDLYLPLGKGESE